MTARNEFLRGVLLLAGGPLYGYPYVVLSIGHVSLILFLPTPLHPPISLHGYGLRITPL